MAENAAAVLADVQMSMKPAIGRHICRDVPASATQVCCEHTTSAEPAYGRGGAAHQHVGLMAMDNISVANFRQQRQSHRIVRLGSHMPGIGDHSHIERSNATRF